MSLDRDETLVVEVSSDAALLAALRTPRRHATAPGLPTVTFGRLIDLLDRVNLSTEELAPQLAEATDAERARLCAIAEGEGGASFGARANAALLLGALGDPTAPLRLSATLRHEPQLVLSAVRELVRNSRMAEPLLENPEVSSALRELEAGPEPVVAARAVQLRLRFDPLMDLPQGTIDRLARASRAASDREDAQAPVDVLRRLIGRGRPAEESEAAMALLRLAADPPPHIAGSGRAYTLGLAARHVGRDGVDVLESLLAEADAAVAGEAALGLARFRGPDLLTLLLSRLDDANGRRAAVEAVGLVMADSADRAVVAQLTRLCLGETSGLDLAALATALVRIGGPLARATALGLLSRLYPTDRQRILWRLEGRTLDDAFDAAVEAGLLRKPPDAALRERARAERWAPIDDEVSELWEHLHRERVMLSYDAETSYPPEHDRLVRLAAAATRGLFTPEAAQQEGSPEGVEHEKPAYQLSFVSDGRAYRVWCRNYGDYYDSDAVLAAVHRALEDLGREERFVPLGIGGQDAHFFFGKPDSIRAFCQRAFIPLARDRAGWERLLNELKDRYAVGLP